MAITKITDKSLADNAVTIDSLGDNLEFQGEYVKIPTITTTARNALSPSAGYIVFNTTTATMEQYDGSSWTEMSKPPIISTLSYSGSATAVDPDGGETITISGSNFKSGVNVRFGQTYATSVTRTNSTSLSVVVPALTAGDYNVIVENGDGMQATLTNGLTSNAAPVFTTASGSLGSIQNDQAITTITLVATETDGGAITYNVTTGALPTGLSLSGADITGTPTGYSAETTANFTVTATDDEGQTTTRSFSLTVLVGFYDYEINQSLRFNDNETAHLTRTPSTGGNQKIFTQSIWVKRSSLTRQYFGIASLENHIEFSGTDNSQLGLNMRGGGSTNYFFASSALYRDLHSWYHIVWAVDTTQATDTNRVKVYVNGEQITSWVDAQYPPQNHITAINSTNLHYLGRSKDSTPFAFDGYMAEFHHIDGQQLTPTSFGESKKGVWVPKAYSGSYGTNGFYLDFANNSNFGEDQSGNNNDWTPNAFDAHDHMKDSPTVNFATITPLTNRVPSTLSEGNLRVDNTTYDGGITIASQSVPSGKWYFEVYDRTQGDRGMIFIGDNQTESTTTGGNNYSSILAHGPSNNSAAYTTATTGTTTIQNTGGSALVAGDVLTCCFDADAGKVWWAVNQAPDVTATENASGLLNPDRPWVIGTYEGGSPSTNWIFNFGADGTFLGNKTTGAYTDSEGYGDFLYQPPSGYLAVCSSNLPDNATFELNYGAKPSDHFKAIAYTGTDADNRAITGLGFQPDLVITKRYNTATNWGIFDSIRGPNKRLISNSTISEQTDDNALISFDTDGFTVSSDGTTNAAGNYIAYTWKAGGTAVSNSDGSIDSQVSANTDAGFSIVTYQSTTGTVGHGLNQTPECIIMKGVNVTDQWTLGHKDLNNGSNAWNYGLPVNLTDSLQTNSGFWNNTAPTSTVFSQGSWDNGYNKVAYCFHSVDGFSQFGSYIGNNSNDGRFVYTGFKPAFVMLKAWSTTQSWIIFDNKRNTYNPETKAVYMNLDYAEETWNNAVDFLSDGFKIRYSHPIMNGTHTYIYMAFAEDPFKYGNAR